MADTPSEWEQRAKEMLEGALQAEEQERRKEQTQQTLMVFLLFSIRVLIIGSGLMFLNNILVREFPNATWLQPGISFWPSLAAVAILVVVNAFWKTSPPKTLDK